MKEIILLYIKKLIQLAVRGANAETFISSIMPMIKISVLLSPFAIVSSKVSGWYIDNGTYVLIVCSAIICDWVLGIWKHLKYGTFSLKYNAIGLVTKTALVVFGVLLFEGLSELTREATFITSPLQMITRLVIFMYPSLSAFENMYKVSDEKFPPKAFMDRIYKWSNTMEVKDLMGNNKKDDED